MRRNVGHQRAIAIRLCWLGSVESDARVVVMDGDGEDLPGDVPRRLAALGCRERRTREYAYAGEELDLFAHAPT